MEKKKIVVILKDKSIIKFKFEDANTEPLKILTSALNSTKENSPHQSNHLSHPIEERRLTVGSSADFNFDLSVIDWEQLLSDTRVVKFEPNTLIFKAGEKQTKIYQIARGDCVLEKSLNNTTLVRNLTTGDIFGESSFLLDTKEQASCTSLTKVEANVFDKSYIELLYATNPVLSAKFFHYLGSFSRQKSKFTPKS